MTYTAHQARALIERATPGTSTLYFGEGDRSYGEEEAYLVVAPLAQIALALVAIAVVAAIVYSLLTGGMS